MKVAVIGAGNGGQAIAGHLAYMGNKVQIYDRDVQVVNELNKLGKIRLSGKLECEGNIEFATTNIGKVVKDVDIIMVVTTATAHGSIARQIAYFLTENQLILLNPGRTCGAIEFKKSLDEIGFTKQIFIAEAQTLVYACRLISIGCVNIIGVKDRVLLAAYPSKNTDYIINRLKPLYTCFYPAKNVLVTSFENIGAIFHPCVVLFNEAAIERGVQFYFYRDMSPALARMIEEVDAERIAVANAYGINIITAKDWVSYAYTGVTGDTLCERMKNNPAYYEILAPNTIECRQITEDIPTGIIPMAALGDIAGVETPLFDALITMCSTLLQCNFMDNGRTLKNLGFENYSKEDILKIIE